MSSGKKPSSLCQRNRSPAVRIGPKTLRHERIFKRALGEKGYADFEQLMKDMLTSENAYKMLKVARNKGYKELFNTGLAYILHPKIASLKVGVDAAKFGYKSLMNALLDKPQIGVTFKKAVKELKKGNFEAAQKDFKALQTETQLSPIDVTNNPRS